MASMGCRKELGQLDTMLPLNRSTDVWREAQPVTKITDSLYPFGDDNDNKRPTVNEVSCTLGKLGIYWDKYYCRVQT